MSGLHPRCVDASEIDNRADWWLREHGTFPTVDALRRINEYRRAERPALRWRSA